MGTSKNFKIQSSGFTKEEELLLQDYSRNISSKSSALFFGNAFIISVTPIWLFWRIYHVDPIASGLFYLLNTLFSTYLMASAYKNVKFNLKHKTAAKRNGIVVRELHKEFSDEKKTSRRDKEKYSWKNNEVADYEATTYSIFYNNAIFLAIVVFSSFFLFKNSSPLVNYVVSIALASGVLALLSTSSQ